MEIMKQLDVVVSPPAFLWNAYLTLTCLTFDLEFFPSYFGLVTYRQTESDAYEPTVHWHRWAQKCVHIALGVPRLEDSEVNYHTNSDLPLV